MKTESWKSEEINVMRGEIQGKREHFPLLLRKVLAGHKRRSEKSSKYATGGLGGNRTEGLLKKEKGGQIDKKSRKSKVDPVEILCSSTQRKNINTRKAVWGKEGKGGAQKKKVKKLVDSQKQKRRERRVRRRYQQFWALKNMKTRSRQRKGGSLRCFFLKKRRFDQKSGSYFGGRDNTRGGLARG